ncbi:MAG: prepilin-type N-terminal cleavage/methylation domain-containing protein [Candidatus Omnitrophota bacterium]|jgi:prepilin-type N-terminal cleavage/methylation domain-containing protein
MKNNINSMFNPLQQLFKRHSYPKKESLKKGLTLIEIIVVITIITILVLLSVPNIVRSRMDSNEFAALANMRSLFNAVQMYFTDNKSYPTTMVELLESSSGPGYISKKLATTGKKSGYIFIYTSNDMNSFYFNADPEAVGKTGRRHFYIDQSGVLRENPTTQATENDTAVQ